MHSKLAGHLPLQDMIQSTIESARSKLAAAEEKNEKSDKVKKLVEYEKKEHGGKIPSVKDEEEEHKEKMSSVIDVSDPREVEKLASALDVVGDLLKEADSIENGGESRQGGEQLPTGSPVGGTQPYKKDGSKKHQVPMATGLEAKKETGSAATAVPDTQHKPPVPLNSAYPKKGVLKTAAESVKELIEKKKAEKKPEDKKEEAKETAEEPKEKASSVARLEAALDKVAKKEPERDMEAGHRRAGAAIGAGLGGLNAAIGSAAHNAHVDRIKRIAPTLGKYTKKTNTLGHGLGGAALGAGLGYVGGQIRNVMAKGMAPKKEKNSSAVDYILGKIAESSQGGMTLDSPSGVGPKPESSAAGGNDARKALESSQAAINMKKVDGKKPQKRMLSEVLSEPAQTKSTDSKVQENLRNATAGGVKIAAAKALLAKIAADPTDPRHEDLKKAIAKKKEEKKEEKEGEEKTSSYPETPSPNPSM